MTKEDICSNIISMSSKQDFEAVFKAIDPNIYWDVRDIRQKVYVLQQAWEEAFPNMEFNPYKTVEPWGLGYEEVAYSVPLQDDILYIHSLFNEITKHDFLYTD